MKITQFQVIIGEDGSKVIFGIDETGYVYQWDYTTGQWRAYWQQKEPNPVPILTQMGVKMPDSNQ